MTKNPNWENCWGSIIRFCVLTLFMLTLHLNYIISNDTNCLHTHLSYLPVKAMNCVLTYTLSRYAVDWGLTLELSLISPLPFLPCFGFGQHRHLRRGSFT